MNPYTIELRVGDEVELGGRRAHVTNPAYLWVKFLDGSQSAGPRNAIKFISRPVNLSIEDVEAIELAATDLQCNHLQAIANLFNGEVVNA